MCVCMSVCQCVCMGMCKYLCLGWLAFLFTSVWERMSVYMCRCVHKDICVCVCVHKDICVCVCVCMHACVLGYMFLLPVCLSPVYLREHVCCKHECEWVQMCALALHVSMCVHSSMCKCVHVHVLVICADVHVWSNLPLCLPVCGPEPVRVCARTVANAIQDAI